MQFVPYLQKRKNTLTYYQMTQKVRKNDSIQQTEGIASKIVDLSRFGQFSPLLNFQMQW